MKEDYDSGIRGLKQINKAMEANGIGELGRYTEQFLDRMGFVDWYKKEQ